MIIHVENVVHTVSAKHSSPLCVYRCWTCLVWFSLFFPQAYLTISWGIYFQSQMLTYFAHLALQAGTEYPFWSLCNLFLHILLETHISVPWDINFFTVPKTSWLLYLAQKFSYPHGLQWRAKDLRFRQTILLWLPFLFNFLSLLTFDLDMESFSLRFSSSEWSRKDAWM